MALIHYYVHGRGRGHATRSAAILAALRRAGHRTAVFAGPDAFPLLERDEGARLVPSLLPSLKAANGSLLVRRIGDARRELAAQGADLVVSDGDLPGILAATIVGLPSIAVGHAEVFGCCRRPDGLPRLPWLREAIVAKASALTATRHVAVNFTQVEARRSSTIVAAPELSDELPRQRTNGPRVLCYFRDDNGLAAVSALVELSRSVVLFSQRDPRAPGVEHHPIDRREFVAALGHCRAVVSSAGSQLLSECVGLGIPVFALYKADEDEQLLNVAMLEHARLGSGCAFEGFDKRRLEAFLSRVDAGDFSRKKAWNAPTAGEAVVRLAQELLHKRRLAS